MRYQIGFSNGKYIVICLTTGIVKHSVHSIGIAEEIVWKLEKEIRDKAERELLVAAGCYPKWCADDDN